MIDIIIPLYNANYSIKKTLISICMQTIKDKVNVYLIDDASTDNYDDILCLFKDKLNIIYLRLDKNSGPGVAREYGLNKSENEYIVFMDSDDVFINCFSLENIYKIINNSNYDLAIGVMIEETINGLRHYSNHHGCLHGKMYKRSYINKIDIHFNDTRSSEDHSFHKLILLSKPNIVYTKEEIYMYRYNKKSLTHISSSLHDIKWYLYNMNWVALNSIERDFDDYEIAKHIFSSLIYGYHAYLYNNNNDILLWCKPLYNLNLKYFNILNDDDIRNIYYIYPFECIPKLTLDYFFNLIGDYSCKNV